MSSIARPSSRSPGKRFDPDALTPEVRQAFDDAVADAWSEFADLRRRVDAGEVTSADAFGTRERLGDQYILRMAGDIYGIYGNTKEEAIYPAYSADAERQPLDASTGRYTLRFEPGGLPPVNAFWSVTMYDLPGRFLVANPLDRYLINSPMLPALVPDADGGLTLHLQHESPGADREPNWLPAPDGPFFAVMRLYWPKPAALDGTWHVPPLRRVA
jgi:hypothetical protein